jgi:hypothetical protein
MVEPKLHLETTPCRPGVSTSIPLLDFVATPPAPERAEVEERRPASDPVALDDIAAASEPAR